MSGDRLLSSIDVERMRDELGRDLRVEEAAARRARAKSLAQAKAEPLPAHRLPPVGAARADQSATSAVGRHTEVLEHTNPYSEAARASEGLGNFGSPGLGQLSVRRPSIEETPDLKKPKLEPSDVDMHSAGPHDVTPQHITPGEPIPSTAEDSPDLDVDIPKLDQADSPSFASQAINIPNHSVYNDKRQPQLVIDLSKQDHLFPEAGVDDDELSHASQQNLPHPAAGLRRLLDSDEKQHVNSGNSGIQGCVVELIQHLLHLCSHMGPTQACLISEFIIRAHPHHPHANKHLNRCPPGWRTYMKAFKASTTRQTNSTKKLAHACKRMALESCILSRLVLSIQHNNRSMTTKSDSLSLKFRNFRSLFRTDPDHPEELQAFHDPLGPRARPDFKMILGKTKKS